MLQLCKRRQEVHVVNLPSINVFLASLYSNFFLYKHPGGYHNPGLGNPLKWRRPLYDTAFRIMLFHQARHRLNFLFSIVIVFSLIEGANWGFVVSFCDVS